MLFLVLKWLASPLSFLPNIFPWMELSGPRWHLFPPMMVEQEVTLENKSPECPFMTPFMDPGESYEFLVSLLIKSEGHQG